MSTIRTMPGRWSASRPQARYGTFTIDAAGVWTYTLDNTNTAVQALNVGQTLTDTFTATTVDGTEQLVIITINGRNDAAVISGAANGSVTEAGGVANGTPTATGDLNSTDVDNNPNDAWTAVGTTPGASGYGSYTLTAAGVWAYTLDNSNPAVQALNAGETLTDTFTAVTIDGTQQLVTITINGRNDAAVISGVANGSVTEAGGVDNGTPGTPPATGDLNSTDVDNPNDLWVAVNTPLLSQFGTYTLTAAGVWTYTLDNDNPAVQARNVGQTLTDTFAVFTVDGTEQLVTITINGANDAAVVTGPVTGTVVEAGELNNSNPGTPTATGDLNSSDLDNPNDAWTPVGTTTGRQRLRQLYAHRRRPVDLHAGQQQSPPCRRSMSGDTLTDTFTVTTVDGTQQLVTITINGSNDAAVISGDFIGPVVEAGGVNNGTPGTPTATGDLNSTDVDDNNPSDAWIAVGTATASTKGYGTYTLDRRRGVDLHAGQQQCGRAGAQCRADTERYVHRHDGRRHFEGRHHHHQRHQRRRRDHRRHHRDGGRGRRCCQRNAGHADRDRRPQFHRRRQSERCLGGGQLPDRKHLRHLHARPPPGCGPTRWTTAMRPCRRSMSGETLTDTFTATTVDGTSAAGDHHHQRRQRRRSDQRRNHRHGGRGRRCRQRHAGHTYRHRGSGCRRRRSGCLGRRSARHRPPAATARYTLTAAGLWTYTLDNSNAAVQALNAGETLTDTFTAVTTDGTQQLVTITINGANDAAVISGAATGSVTEAGGVDNGTPGTPTATGDLNSTDVDNPNDLWVPVNTPLLSQFGTYTLTAAGVWTYTLDNNNPAVQARNVGQTLTDTFAVFTVGGTEQLVTITINGANDAAVVTGPVTGTVVEAGELNNSNPGTPTATGDLSSSDLDNPNDAWTPVGTTPGASGYGSYTLTAAGLWIYTLDNSNAAVQALNVGRDADRHVHRHDG